MNLSKLFLIQKKLDDRIVKEKGLEGQDLLDKKILSLQVELGELANEWRGFKFWSENQEPRAEVFTTSPKPNEPLVIKKNPLLEEYVDCLHFILSIGNDLGINEHQDFCGTGTKNVITLFAKINRYVAELWWECHDNGKEKSVKWLFALANFISLGEHLGFAWEQIEQAYLDKNKVNHERQENGY